MDGNESDRPRHKLAQLCPGFGGENREEEEEKERGDGGWKKGSTLGIRDYGERLKFRIDTV